ncbi:AAA family ATPase [Algoriphagus persicinus]|uniref:AAA family ATPase n=1 Tax=Algoriphagus persicinus TaxID=3108754 RepID=UPI002B365C5B|nr:AAA family ATPase [Algoriphagus sp. E1-3-M2]MEB2786507.1 AAA family ATPase [Algoriphagus sp. E1-3-M2]
MNSISFKNFRRFQDFPSTEIGPITFLVGRNNSGKSTMVKAILLVSDFLKSRQLKNFSLTNSVLEEANIVTFERAKNKLAKHSDVISFVFDIEEFSIGITIYGHEGKTNAEVTQFVVNDKKKGFFLKIEPQKFLIDLESYKVKNITSKDEEAILLDELIERRVKLKKEVEELSGDKASYEFIEKNQELLDCEATIKIIKTRINANNKAGKSFVLSDTYSKDESFIKIVRDFAENQLFFQNMLYNKIQKGNKKVNKEYENYQAFKEDGLQFLERFNELSSKINLNEFYYLGANPTKQSALFAIRDRNNSLAQAVHEYCQQDIDKRPGSNAFGFVRKWIQEPMFEIGEDVEFKLHAGEAYEVTIKSNNVKIPLADKGMGSIQAILLILRLACIIDRMQDRNEIATIIIEEPELNLHPALQSKLAWMFMEVYEKYNIHLIIETHSEYLIRNTQVIVKENEYDQNLNPNPFNVIYFDKNMKQWKMNYRNDGKFIEDFGNGFFDEASSLALDLF